MNLRILLCIIIMTACRAVESSDSSVKSIDQFSFELPLDKNGNMRTDAIKIHHGYDTVEVDLSSMLKDGTDKKFVNPKFIAKGTQELKQSSRTITPFASATKGTIFVFEEGEEANRKEFVFKLFMDCFPATNCATQAEDELALSKNLKDLKIDYSVKTVPIFIENKENKLEPIKFGVTKDFVPGHRLYELVETGTFQPEVHGTAMRKLLFDLSREGAVITDMNPGNLMFTNDGLRVIDGEWAGLDTPQKALKKNFKSMTSKLKENSLITWMKSNILNRGKNTPKVPGRLKTTIEGLISSFDPEGPYKDYWQRIGDCLL